MKEGQKDRRTERQNDRTTEDQMDRRTKGQKGKRTAGQQNGWVMGQKGCFSTRRSWNIMEFGTTLNNRLNGSDLETLR